jgi:DNA repair protein RadC
MKLYTKSGETYLPASDDQIIETARAIAERNYVGTKVSLTTPRATHDFLIMQFATMEHELFAVVFLDTRHRVITVEIMFRGTIDGASVYPREVMKAALKHNAAALIFAHNHPSGVAEPSQADEIITTRLVQALAFVDIRVLDHVIVAGTRTTSFLERGLM